MASAYTDEAKNLMLTQLSGAAKFMSLHTATPATSANELSGGSYTRQSVSFGTPSSGSVSVSNQPVFSVPAGTQIAAVGYWSSPEGGTFYGWSDFPAESYVNPGQVTVVNASLNLNG